MIAKYQKATLAIEEENYTTARIVFKELGNFLDSAAKLEETNQALYANSQNLLKDGDISHAYKGFQYISDYADSAEIIAKIESDYQAAKDLLDKQEYDRAISAFIALKNYADSETMAVESQYQKACSLQSQGKYEEAIPLFHAISSYRSSGERENICQYNIAEALLADQDIEGAIVAFESIDYKDSIDRAYKIRYEYALKLWQDGDLQSAAGHFMILGKYPGAEENLIKVSTELADQALEGKDYVTALTAYQNLEQTDEIKAKEYKLAQLCYDEGHYAEATSAYETLGQYELSLSRLPVARYAWANQLFQAGEYAKAAEQFSMLGDMTDSASRAKESLYQLAAEYLESKEYDRAKALFSSITGYNDADTQAKECDYRKANALLNEGKNQEAQVLFEALGSYSDSKMKAQQCIYNQAKALFEAKEYEKAKELYDTISYSDSKTKAKQCVYNQAEALFDAGNYSAAKKLYASVNYKDSQEKANLSAYQEAQLLYDAQKYAEAETIFLELKKYSDSADRAKDCHLRQGIVLMQAENYPGALEFFETVDYQNSAALAAQCHYELGRAEHVAGNVDSAVAQYAYATSMPEAREALMSVAKDYSAINEIEEAIQTLWLIREQEAAKDMLLEIGALKEQSGEPILAALAYSTIGNSDLAVLHNLVTKISFIDFNKQISTCSLISEKLQYKNEVRYVFAAVALEEKQYDIAASAYDSVGEYKDASTMAKESKYQKGEKLLENQEYYEAYQLFSELKSYKDSSKKTDYSRYQQGIQLMNKKNYAKAAEVFSSISYEDSKTKMKECRYLEGKALYSSKKYEEAVSAFELADNYQDTKDMLNKAKARILYSVISFGHYEQDNREKNGKEEIEWIVINVTGNKAMLLSRYVLDCQKYNSKRQDINWEKCSLRSWLNKEFLNSAFSKDEQSAILTVNVDNSKVQGDSTYSWTYRDGNNTKDRIYILSYKEYFEIRSNKIWKEENYFDEGKSTSYAESKGAIMEFAHSGYGYGKTSSYWLRTPSTDDHSLAYYRLTQHTFGAYVDDTSVGVRPVLWIDLTSPLFR